MEVNKTSISASDITDDVFGTNNTKRYSDARDYEIPPYDMGFCRRKNDEDQKQGDFNSHTGLAKPSNDIKQGRQAPCTCQAWSSYLPILNSKRGQKKRPNQYLSNPLPI